MLDEKQPLTGRIRGHPRRIAGCTTKNLTKHPLKKPNFVNCGHEGVRLDYDIKNGLKSGDKTYKIIVDTKCAKPDLPKELRALFDHINRNEPDVSDDPVCAIDRQVSIVNREISDAVDISV